MHWWPKHTPRIGVERPKRPTAATETPASFGVHGPGEMTMCEGAGAQAGGRPAELADVAREVVDEGIVIVDDEDRGGHGDSAATRARAFATVSSYSSAGSESATMPPPSRHGTGVIPGGGAPVTMDTRWNTVAKVSRRHSRGTSIEPSRHTRDKSLRSRSTIITFSARSFSLPSSNAPRGQTGAEPLRDVGLKNVAGADVGDDAADRRLVLGAAEVGDDLGAGTRAGRRRGPRRGPARLAPRAPGPR